MFAERSETDFTIPPVVSRVILPCLLILLFACLACWVRWRVMDFRSNDYNWFLRPWYLQVWRQGDAGMLDVSFSNYPPLYLYLMRLAQWVLPPMSIPHAIKIISIAGDLVGAALIARIAYLHFGGMLLPAIFAALGMLLLPTVYTNSAQWAQCDILYGLCLLGAFHAAMRGRMAAALLWFGVGFSFKPHAIFLAPFLGAMLVARDAPYRLYPLPLLVYAVSLLPAAYFGSDFWRLLWLYVDATKERAYLSANAPNFYVLAGRLGYDAETLRRWGYTAFSVFSLFYFSAACRILARTMKEDRRKALRAGALLAYGSALYMPFFLPHMHDRYFFAADLFAYVTAVTHWPWALAAAFQQLASLTGYANYLRGHEWFGGLSAYKLLGWGAIVHAALLTAVTVKMAALLCDTFPASRGLVERVLGRAYRRINRVAERIDD